MIERRKVLRSRLDEELREGRHALRGAGASRGEHRDAALPVHPPAADPPRALPAGQDAPLELQEGVRHLRRRGGVVAAVDEPPPLATQGRPGALETRPAELPLELHEADEEDEQVAAGGGAAARSRGEGLRPPGLPGRGRRGGRSAAAAMLRVLIATTTVVAASVPGRGR